eukprot:scaffold875_cov185-Amphora_coffeaeformis.AAC.14
MLRFSCTFRRASSRSASLTIRPLQTVAVQLDYYMSSQFAGIACGMTNQLYEKNGIALKFLPICPVGHEMLRVRDHADSHTSIPTIGCVEQNIFVPLLHHDPKLKLKAIAAMFRRSPLCVASIKGQNNDKNVVGAHEDTVALLQRILAQSGALVEACPRPTKNHDLKSGKYSAIQAYLTTEVATLQRQLGTDAVVVEHLEGLNGAQLGYSQMLFTTEEDLREVDRREIVQAFLDATFQGWHMAIRNHEAAAKSVQEAMRMCGLDDENNDHWDSSQVYTIESVGLCCDFVKESFQGDRLGVISKDRWNAASKWLLPGIGPVKDFGLDTEVWQPPSQLLSGNELARVTLEKAKTSAEAFSMAHGRMPSLAVITVGELPRYTHGSRRLDILSNHQNSWFDKTACGKANGIAVQEILLPKTTSTHDLLSQIYALKHYDGIQLMWPLPDHIDSSKVYNAIDFSQDVDGAHYIGQIELNPSSTAFPPVTPDAVMKLIDNHHIEVSNKKVLVIGRSRIVGSPLARMLRDRGAVVFTAHSEVDPALLEELVGSADVICSCAGLPGLVQASWVRQGAVVVNIGATFVESNDSLVSDFEGDLSSVANRYSPVPGGIGPLSVACLFSNVTKAAWRRSVTTGNVEDSWTKSSESLRRTVHFQNYTEALRFADKVNKMSTEMDHHANMAFSHRCVDGVDVDLEFFTFEANEVTEKDYQAARAVNYILLKDKVSMEDVTYNLKMESVARYPADPRGSSRLLKVDSSGKVAYFDNFSESFLGLADSAHIVFNESKVANARVNVKAKEGGESIEMMILDLADFATEICSGLCLNVMLREEGVQRGAIFAAATGNDVTFKVVEVVAPWIEDEHSNGNGTEVIVECAVSDTDATLAEVLDSVGSVPIPPYLNREAEEGDKTAYNNVYAENVGSVAAPTAGLHFTQELLEKIGQENISFLSLHVGAGTFQPVVTENALDHKMHGESFHVDASEIKRLVQVLESGKRMIVVGTTSCRTLESLYWCGVKKILGVNADSALSLGQKEWVDLKAAANHISAPEALNALLCGNKSGTISGRTSLMIVPGSYDFKVVSELITNLHAPDSTLMLLVSSFLGSGEKVKQVYEDAQEAGFRFLSYGDVCMFSKPNKEA